MAHSRYMGYFDLEKKLLYRADEVSKTGICATNLSCLWNFIIYGLTQGGGIGDIEFGPPNDEAEKEFTHNKVMKKQLIDVTFFILINILLMNMVSGIIIDTFSELRGEKN